MLVLSRKDGERIVMSGGVRITVVEVGRGRVKIGIEAPPDIKVWREELLPKDGSTPNDPCPIAKLSGATP